MRSVRPRTRLFTFDTPLALGCIVLLLLTAALGLSCTLPKDDGTTMSGGAGGTTPVQTTSQMSGQTGDSQMSGVPSNGMDGGASMPTSGGTDMGMGSGTSAPTGMTDTSSTSGSGDSTVSSGGDISPSGSTGGDTTSPTTASAPAGYVRLGGALASGPAVSSWASERLDVFVSGPGRALWHKWYDGRWAEWENLGGLIKAGSDPAAVSWGEGRIDIFVRGDDDALWHKWWDSGGGGWSGWESLGGTLTSSPAACSWGSNHLEVFIRGADGHLMVKAFTGSWSEWGDLGGLLKEGSSPAAVCWGDGRIDVFVRGMDDALWHKGYAPRKAISYETMSAPSLVVPAQPLPSLTINPRAVVVGVWSDWENLGGLLSSSPGVSSWGTSRLDVFVRGPGNTLWHRWFDNAWGDWENLRGSQFISDPDAVSWDVNRIDIFVTGTDNALWHRWWGSSGWGP